MAQIIKQPDIGERIGEGISSGIQALASQKLEKIAKNNKYQENLGVLKALQVPNAEAWAHADEKTLQKLLGEKIEEPRNAAFERQFTSQQQQNNPQQQQQTQGTIGDHSFTPQRIQQMEEFLSSPELQQNATPEQIEKATQKLAQLKQNPQQQNQPLQQQQTPTVSPRPEQLIQAENIKNKRTDLEYKKAKEERAIENDLFNQQKSLKPFLDEQTLDYERHREIKTIVNDMLRLIQKNKKDWPGPITGNLPGQVQAIFQRNPNIRTYVAKANELVGKLAGFSKGPLTIAKIKFAQLAKSDLSQPVDTQIDLLKGVLNRVRDSEDIQKFIGSKKDKNGRYPLDLKAQVVERQLAQEYPLEYPQYYKDGTEYEDEDGNIHILKDGEWSNK